MERCWRSRETRSPVLRNASPTSGRTGSSRSWSRRSSSPSGPPTTSCATRSISGLRDDKPAQHRATEVSTDDDRRAAPRDSAKRPADSVEAGAIQQPVATTRADRRRRRKRPESHRRRSGRRWSTQPRTRPLSARSTAARQRESGVLDAAGRMATASTSPTCTRCSGRSRSSPKAICSATTSRWRRSSCRRSPIGRW